MTDFIEGEYLEEQVNAIKEISDHITQLKRVGSGLGEFTYVLYKNSFSNK
jgi:ferritin heavy chain